MGYLQEPNSVTQAVEGSGNSFGRNIGVFPGSLIVGNKNLMRQLYENY